jgi:hypothetical protein
MIRRERERGSRRDILVVDDDAWHDTLMRADQIYAPMQSALRRALDELPADDPARRRLRISYEFMAFILDEVASMDERWAARMKELGL